MEIKQLKRLISEGEIDQVIKYLINFSENFYTELNKDIFHTSARYNYLLRDKINGVVSVQDYNLELNSITFGLIEIVTSINDLDPKYFKKVDSSNQIHEDIEKLSKEFDDCQNIKSTPTRLRMKNHLSRKISEKFIQIPALINEFKFSDKEGIICGISDKIKLVPDNDDLDVLEEIARRATKNFTKGKIVNAIAEILYSGQIRIGDDVRIDDLLDLLNNNADLPLEKNIERVRVALHYAIGK
jgi:hypothetical protein